MKMVKYILFAVAGIVVLLVLIVAIVFATFDPNKYKPEIAAAVKEKTGRTLAIEGNIGLSFYPSIGVAVGGISLSEPGSSRTFARIDQVRVSLALLPLLSRRVVIDRVTLSGLAVDLLQHKGGKTNFADLAGAPGGAQPASGPRKTPPGGAVHLDVAGIDIRSSTIGWRDESSGNRFKVSVAELRTGRIASGVPGKLSLSARVEASQPKADMQIKLSSGYRLDFEKQTLALSRLDLKVADAAAGSTAPPTSLQGDLEFDASPQALRFALAVDRLNLDRVLPPPAKAGASGGAGAPASGGGPAAPTDPAKRADQPIDLSALKGLRLKGSLKIGELVASNVKAEKVDVGLQAAGGRLEVKPLAAALYKGNFSGDASVDANGDRFALKGKLNGVAIGPLLRDALNNDLLEGQGNIALDIQTGGTTVSTLKKALAGSASLSLRDGALKGINLDQAIRKARSLSGSKAAAEQGASRSERTDFTEIGASFVIKNGVARNEDLSAKSPLLRLAGSGSVDIGANTIDYLAKATLVATSTGQGSQDQSGLRGVTVPVKITGALDAPRFRVDLGATVGDAVKHRAEEQLKERMQDRLKGLLRR